MPTLKASTSWRASLVKAQACLLILCSSWAAAEDAAAAAEQPQAQLSITELESLLIPPVGWKLDKEVLRNHFWLLSDSNDELPGGEEWIFTVYPFWPAFFQFTVRNEHVNENGASRYPGELGALLSDALHSPDPAIKKKAALWLHQSLTLYFAGFRLSKRPDFLADNSADSSPSKLHEQRPYAPWIKPEDARRLDLLADKYISAQRVIKTGKEQEEVSPMLALDWITRPRSRALPDIVSYYDMLGASPSSIAVDHIYPFRWSWGRNKGNLTMTPYVGIDLDMPGLRSYRLIPDRLPPSTDPVCLWLRDVILSYIAGKELLEGKKLPLADKSAEAPLQDALQQWWSDLEKQSTAAPAAK
ncbi:hypothetical protein [Prosthecobacter sp.]|uniref:hypothetical protein n=1 Tax=Prosthecobacter sp. TaxID=1965333 RepID=UPI002489622C|nr:hypothetical protein [Prosthecobacter sp.]MDI1311377.1 hypothetical protein [Prosthecobacter sp.]